ncbi:MAG TPA: hypothetical protein VM577_14685 [Anaerovoracaceae bacterium]|nr:hypothetical protein [Anaerovoracaceae bacterium]
MNKKILQISFIFTLVYVLCEIVYNLGLVEFLASKNTEIGVFSNLENFGKALSSIGLSLVLIKIARNSKAKIAAFIILVPLLFTAETVGFDKLVKGLSPEVKVNTYLAGVYRNAVLNGSIKDDRFTELNAYNKVVLANLWTLGSDKEKVRKGVETLLYSKPDDTIINEFYRNYIGLTSRIVPYYAAYAIESKKYDDYTGKAKEIVNKEFIRRIGIAQGLNQSQFVDAVATRSPSFKKYQATVIIPAQPKLGIMELKAGDIPLGLSQQEFHKYVAKRFDDILAKTQINAENIDLLPHSYDLISSVIVPPIAIFLSLLSILLNTSILLVSVKKPLVVVPSLLAVTAYGLFTYNPYGVADPVNRAMGVEVRLFQILTPVAAAIHATAINDQHPNEAQVIRIKKPELVDFKDLDEQMQALKTTSDTETQDLPKVDERVTADTQKLQTDQGYFGEVKTKTNPYLSQ